MTPEQRRRLRASSRDDAGPLSSFLSPAATASKVERVHVMAASADVRIRESAALAVIAPPDVLSLLAGDAERSVRCSVARNAGTPPEVLGRLGADADAGVRAWVAANPSVPASLLDVLGDDPDPTVRSVAAWARRWQIG